MHPYGTKALILAPQLVDNAVGRHVMLVMMSVTMTLKKLCYKAWQKDCNGVTTFNSTGKCHRTLSEVKPENDDELKAQACFIDPETGIKGCN